MALVKSKLWKVVADFQNDQDTEAVVQKLQFLEAAVDFNASIDLQQSLREAKVEILRDHIMKLQNKNKTAIVPCSQPEHYQKQQPIQSQQVQQHIQQPISQLQYNQQIPHQQYISQQTLIQQKNVQHIQQTYNIHVQQLPQHVIVDRGIFKEAVTIKGHTFNNMNIAHGCFFNGKQLYRGSNGGYFFVNSNGRRGYLSKNQLLSIGLSNK